MDPGPKPGSGKEDSTLSGSKGRIRITGSVSSEQERVEAEGRLLAAAGGQPMDLAISVLAPQAGGVRNRGDCRGSGGPGVPAAL